MSKIKILSAQEIQKIAAGEVIERPVNILKELIENSIDANADQITIYLEEGGKRLIKVIDNGFGMSPDDAKICFVHHATSKITSFDDLVNINTFGFRGEALSSISAVSTISIKTKETKCDYGVNLIIDSGKIIQESIISCNNGTQITVEKLFLNIPARKKFLKSNDAEYRAILSLFYAFCFSYININFKLYHDNKLVYNCPSVINLRKRFEQLYTDNLVNNILELSQEDNKYKISGIISNSKYSKYDRSGIFLFVNNRWIKNYKLVHAFIKGYQQILDPGKFPAGVLKLSIDPKEVDINIHPRKEEVQFLHPKLVENLVINSIRNTLENNFDNNLGLSVDNYSKSNYLNKDIYIKDIKDIYKFNDNFNNDSVNNKSIRFLSKEDLDRFFESDLSKNLVKNKTMQANSSVDLENYADKIESKTDNIIKVNNNLEFNSQLKITDIDNIEINYKLIGQLLKTYIVIEIENGMTLIDQHAAHERIIYQRLIEAQKNNISVNLLFPEIIELNKDDLNILEEYFVFFEKLGITIERISANSVVVKTVPISVKNLNLKDVILKTLAIIQSNQKLDTENINSFIRNSVNAQISCKAAVKSGDLLSFESMNKLILDLYKIDDKLTCPHGRPTIYNITVGEIEKYFKRNYKQKIDLLV